MAIAVAFQEFIESLHETGHGNRVVLGDVLQVAAHENQAPCVVLVFSGGEAGLGALDLALEGFFPETLYFQKSNNVDSLHPLSLQILAGWQLRPLGALLTRPTACRSAAFAAPAQCAAGAMS